MCLFVFLCSTSTFALLDSLLLVNEINLPRLFRHETLFMPQTRVFNFNIGIRFSMITRQNTLLDIAVLSTILRSMRRLEDSITSVPHKPHVRLCLCLASKNAIQGSLGLISETWLPISGDIEIERITRELRRTEDIGVYMYYLFQDTNLATTWDHTTNLECQ